MLHELWQDSTDHNTVCLAGPKGNVTRMSLRADAKVVWTFDAVSHYDAMNQYFRYRGWGRYVTTDPAFDKRTYADRGWE